MVYGLMPRHEPQISRTALFEQLEYKPHSEEQWAIHNSDARFRVPCCGRRFGKALSTGTPILTSSGWKTMLEVETGDVVYDEQGQPCNVTAHTDIMLGHSCYLIKFSDGSEVVADAEHEWLTWDKPARRAIGDSRRHTLPNLRTTEEISLSLLTNSGENNHAIQVTRPIQFSVEELPI